MKKLMFFIFLLFFMNCALAVNPYFEYADNDYVEEELNETASEPTMNTDSWESTFAEGMSDFVMWGVFAVVGALTIGAMLPIFLGRR